MSLPTKNDVQVVDPVLTGMLVGYKNADTRFVASRVFPSVSVDKDSGTYYELTKKYWLLDEVKRRAPGSQFARGGYGVTSGTYAAQLWGLEHAIPYENEANNQMPLGLDRVGLQWLAHQSLIRKERAWAGDFMTTSVWGTNDTSTTDFDDYASSDPVTALRTAKRTISQATAQLANTLVMGEIVHDYLIGHPDIIDRMKYVHEANIASIEQAIVPILGFPNYYVGSAIYNSANEAQTESDAAIIDDDLLVCYVAPGQPDMMTATAGLTFVWGGGGGDGEIVKYWDQSVKSDILQLSESWDQKRIGQYLGYFFSDIV